jgi:hypothetical protein
MERAQLPLRLQHEFDRPALAGERVRAQLAPSNPALGEARSWSGGRRRRGRPALPEVLPGVEDRGSRRDHRPLPRSPRTRRLQGA